MTTSEYVRENFDADDWLAVVLLDKRNGRVIQRLTSAAQVASAEFQDWIRLKNDVGWDVYVSMNALRPEATGRTKADIGTVRHLYLDFDEHGTEQMEQLLQRSDLPRPNFRLNTSPGKWQAVWKAEGFTTYQAEDLQRSLARDTGADWAATDCARVLRLPGFYNRKYQSPHLVTVEKLSNRANRPPDFPRITRDVARPTSHRGSPQRDLGKGLSQSEKDWAFAKRALARGQALHEIAAAIAAHRPEKSNPRYYAELTVENASRALAMERANRENEPTTPDR